jgi:hypothetical protein
VTATLNTAGVWIEPDYLSPQQCEQLLAHIDDECRRARHR